jgi:hypothetical protein
MRKILAALVGGVVLMGPLSSLSAEVPSAGWLNLSASNFTFSSPTLKVKLSQAKKKVILSCTNGTKVVKVTTTSCPKDLESNE